MFTCKLRHSGFLLELRTMEVVVTTGTIRHAKLQSNHHDKHTDTQLFYRPDVLLVNQSWQSTEGEQYHNRWTRSPQPHLGLPSLSWPLTARGLPWESWQASCKPSDANTVSVCLSVSLCLCICLLHLCLCLCLSLRLLLYLHYVGGLCRPECCCMWSQRLVQSSTMSTCWPTSSGTGK